MMPFEHGDPCVVISGNIVPPQRTSPIGFSPSYNRQVNVRPPLSTSPPETKIHRLLMEELHSWSFYTPKSPHLLGCASPVTQDDWACAEEEEPWLAFQEPMPPKRSQIRMQSFQTPQAYTDKLLKLNRTIQLPRP